MFLICLTVVSYSSESSKFICIATAVPLLLMINSLNNGLSINSCFALIRSKSSISRYLSFVADFTKDSFGCSNNGASSTDITFLTFTTCSSSTSSFLRFERLSIEKILSLLRATTKNSEEENLSLISSYNS